MTDLRDQRQDRSAHSMTGRRRRAPLWWLPWAALLLLLIAGAAVFLIARNADDSGDQPGLDVVDDASGPQTTAANVGGAAATGVATTTPAPGNAAASPTTSATATTMAAGSAGGQPNAAATLTAGEQPILPVPSEGLGAYVGRPVTGTGVTVESVVADEGFWVGSGPDDRVFVFLTPQARTTEGESPFQVQPGQRINLQGTLVVLPGEPETFGVEPGEGADQLRDQAHRIDATTLSLS